MPSVIVQVGLTMGPRFRYVRPADPSPECYEIHLGDDLVELSEAEAAVWGAASLRADRQARLEVSRASFVDFLRTAPTPIADAEALVDSLIQRGLLVEFDTDGPLEPVFRRYRLMPLGQGLGSTAEHPHQHRIGVAGVPLLAVPNTTYVQWSFSFLHPDLWTACVYFADDDEHVAEGGEPLDLTGEMVASEVAEQIPLMIATGTAFLDPVSAS